MKYADVRGKLSDYRRQIAAIRETMRETLADVEPQPVDDYAFATLEGPVRLSQLFGTNEDLIVIHNMGVACNYCTLWADGFNGIYPHLTERLAFVVSSPDAPEVQQRLAAARGWRVPMVSHQETSFAADMGYRSEKGGWLPGLSVFRRQRSGIVRVADTGFHPGDDFCVVWHVLGMIPQPLAPRAG